MPAQKRTRYPRNTQPASRAGFTLIELLVVIAILSVLAAIIFPVFAQVRERARQTACSSNLKQIGTAFAIYVQDYDEQLPHRRDLKTTLPGGYRPWTTWPPSDPRAGWAALALEPYARNHQIWACPSVAGSSFGRANQVRQAIRAGIDSPSTSYWLWRFDQTVDPVPLDNLWGKSEVSAVADLQAAANPQVGFPESPSDVEMAVDPYFPNTIPSVASELKGRSVHFGGRNRLFLDSHVKYLRDRRTH